MVEGSLKRIFDIAASVAGIIVLAPVMLVTAVAMGMANNASPFFRQERVGLHGQPFTIYKIRTMKVAFDAAGKPLPEDQRTTKLGKIFRKTRLDELPQLFNILKGDMSVVGPRPVQAFYQISQDVVRTSVKPGLTGLAQLSGSVSLSTGDVLKQDKAYIEKLGKKTPLQRLFYDVSIIARTLPSLIRNRRAPHFRQIKKLDLS